MATHYRTLVGTVGTGIWYSNDAGESWDRCQGMWNETLVFALTPHPQDPKVVFAGAHDGIYRSADGGITFDAIDSPLSGKAIWSVAFDPVEPDTIFAGARPGAIFRSHDGGHKWEQLNAHFADECPNVRFPRVLSMAVDPTNHQIVWAGVEVDGVRRSLDGGETWETTGAAVTPGTIGRQLNNPDIHGIVVSSASPTTVFVSTPREVFTSTDAGENWQPLGVQDHFPMPYCRSLALKADDPNILFVANGDAARGEAGTMQRSKDRGQSWETLPLPVVPNTPMWTFATHVAEPDLMVTCSHYGQVLISEDAGDSWRKVRREFSEIRALAWVPL